MTKPKRKKPPIKGVHAVVDLGLDRSGMFTDLPEVLLTTEGHRILEAFRAGKASLSPTGKFTLTMDRVDKPLFNRAGVQAASCGAAPMSWINAQVYTDRGVLFQSSLVGQGATIRYIRFLGKDPANFSFDDNGVMSKHAREKLQAADTTSQELPTGANASYNPEIEQQLESAVKALKSSMMIRNKSLEPAKNMNILASTVVLSRNAWACIIASGFDKQVIAANLKLAGEQLRTNPGLEAVLLHRGTDISLIRSAYEHGATN